MALQYPEGIPIERLELSPQRLIDVCEAQASLSERFRTGRNLESGRKYEVVDNNETTFTFGLKAEHDFDETSEEIIGQTYNLSLTASHLLKDFIPAEVHENASAKRKNIEEDVDKITGVEVDYSLGIYLSSDGIFEWLESRSYDIWYDIDHVIAEDENKAEAELDESEQPPVCTHYHKALGRHIVGQEDDEPPVDPEAEKMRREFEALMGQTCLAAEERAGYLDKAKLILSAYILGEEAEFDLADYFPADIVQNIQARHTS